VEKKTKEGGAVDWTVAGRKLHIAQDLVQSPETIGLAIWESSYVLSRYLEKNCRERLKNKQVVELGSGTGIPGITAVLLGAKVLLTDVEETLDLLRENVRRNIPSSALPRVDVFCYNWGTDVSTLLPYRPPFDVIIASDVLYDEEGVNSLLKSLVNLSSPQSLILIAVRPYVPECFDLFFRDVHKFFDVKQIEFEDYGATENDKETTIVSLTKKENLETS
jgi:predicted nicotinamide N-methyase